ncbi:hypothetical protein [Halalkalicoccus subterraneus]|uniref:hypothetical protein n=1 Tax=Halalkalicoccus subterraneus TaxID=2675002 RepID=UPI000EFAC0A4|nr:hypothetical protein [Halalkalicoccus subterraneus]
MGKVSIGLRGWRFEEEEVFDDEGEFKPLEEIPEDTRLRLERLEALVTSPCQACWLIHGDANIAECNVAEAVYGEPRSEVVLCEEHEADFLYWFRDEGGREYMGEDGLKDAFHEWFADGGRAPGNYGGIEHVETDPGDVPEPSEVDFEAMQVPDPEDGKKIDLREFDISQEYPSS